MVALATIAFIKIASLSDLLGGENLIRRKLTPFGVEVKKRLLDLRISQSAFCRQYGIPQNRFSESLYNTNASSKYRDWISRILDINLPQSDGRHPTTGRVGKDR